MLATERAMAGRGDVFFARVALSNGSTIERPVFIVGGKGNDVGDVIVCSCTTTPARSDFDIPITLQRPTYVRSNKIYTINRASLLFKIPQQVPSPDQIQVFEKVVEALGT